MLSPSLTEGVPEEPYSAPYFIGKSQNEPIQLSHFVFVNVNDLAVKVRPALSRIEG